MNVFSSNFEDNNREGFQPIYKLNSLSPFAHSQFSGFDTMTPYYTPNGASKYTYYPTKTSYQTNQDLRAFAYDINEPRYAELYQQYYNFFNKNLDSL